MWRSLTVATLRGRSRGVVPAVETVYRAGDAGNVFLLHRAGTMEGKYGLDLVVVGGEAKCFVAAPAEARNGNLAIRSLGLLGLMLVLPARRALTPDT